MHFVGDIQGRFVQFSPIDIDYADPGFAGKGPEIVADLPNIQTAAENQHIVGILNCKVAAFEQKLKKGQDWQSR